MAGKPSRQEIGYVRTLRKIGLFVLVVGGIVSVKTGSRVTSTQYRPLSAPSQVCSSIRCLVQQIL